MSVRWTTKFDRVPQMTKNAFALKGTRVDVGVGGPHAHLARIHEFGCSVPVSEKMRGFLRARGVHLKKETVRIVIPQRSFLRAGFDAAKGAAAASAAEVFAAALDGRPADPARTGRLLAEGIRAYAKAGVGPPKKSFPGASAAPALTDTGAMLDGIDFEVHTGG